jgi:serine/threonine-protein kinase
VNDAPDGTPTNEARSGLRYAPLVKLASGGMATVYVGALRGPLGFRTIVALKRLHPHLLEDASSRAALLAEARLASRIRHANVVDVRDVEVVGESVQLVMDYVEGAPLGQLIARGGIAIGAPGGGARIPPGVAVRIVLDACARLHAAHELLDDSGAPVGLVHRDVSPQNLIVGLDGVTRVADFGIAKEALGARDPTTDGALKGKIGYLAPEYVRGQPVDRRADVFALGVVLWEALAHKRLFRGANEAEALELVLRAPAPSLAGFAPEVGERLDAVVSRAVAKSPSDRFASAAALGEALEAAARPAGLVASHAEVGRTVAAAVADEIAERRAAIQERLAAWDRDPTAAQGDRSPAAAAPSTAPSRARPVARFVGMAATLGAVATVGFVLLRRPSEASPPSPSAEPPLASVAAGASTSASPVAASAASAGLAPSSTPSSTASAHASPPRASAAPTRGGRPLPTNPYR